MNDPFRTVLRALKAMRINLLDAVDRAVDVIDASEAERETSRREYARDLTDYIEGPTQALHRRKEPT